MEQIGSDICAKGRELGFIVFPEFKLDYEIVTPNGETIPHHKKPDLVWIATPNNDPNVIDLPHNRIVGAFEIEGYNVALATVTHHLDVYPRICQYQGYVIPCVIALYSLAINRETYGANLIDVDEATAGRRAMVAAAVPDPIYPDIVKIGDGIIRDWLDQAAARAVQLKDEWLG